MSQARYWPETAWKLAPSAQTLRLQVTWWGGLLGSLTPLLSTWAPLPRRVSCFVGACVTSDNSFLSVRPELTLGPWKGNTCVEVELALKILLLFSHSGVSDSFCDPRDCSLPGSSVHGIFQAKNAGMCCDFLLQGIFPTQEINPWLPSHLLHCRQILYR